MKNTRKLMAMVFALVFMFTVMMSGAVFADKNIDKENGKSSTTTEDKLKGNDKVKTEESITEGTDADAEEDQLSEEKAALLADKKELKKALAEAREKANYTDETEANIAALVKALAENKAALKQLVIEQYTAEELAQLDAEAAAIEAADPTADALPLDKVIAKGRSLKFDMPPIYKEGKVMVPVRAFSAAYGADVQWNGETKEITIKTLEGKTVVINMSVQSAPTVTVDGSQVVIAVKNVNGRVVLPVGFIAEQLGLKAEVDEEDGTVEIDVDDEVVDPLVNTPTVQ